MMTERAASSDHATSDRARARQVSRRGFLSASGAVGAAVLVPGKAHALVRSDAAVEHTDIVVVGAGLAGLVAASNLRSTGLNVLVLEASEQAGGRIASDGGVASPGTVVSEGHTAVLGLAAALGVPTSPVGEMGETSVAVLGGKRRSVSAGSLSGDPDVDREVGVALTTLNRMAAEIDPDEPWASENAATRDAVSLGSWTVDNVASGPGRNLLAVIARAVWAAEPAAISLQHALATIAGAGGAGPLVNASVAPMWRGPMLVDAELRPVAETSCRRHHHGSPTWASVARAEHPVSSVTIEGGVSAITDRLLVGLATRVRTSAVAQAITQDADGVVVSGNGFEVRADRAIVATPLPAAAALRFEPGLSANQRGLLRLSSGDVTTVVCEYDGHLGRSTGLSGPVLAGSGPLTVGRAWRNGGGTVVVSHACGEAARAWARTPEQERRNAALQTLVEWFGPAAARPRTYSEHDGRSDAWSRAGWGLVAPPGTVTSVLRAVQEPLGRVHFAGSERASRWAGWLEGAVRSGQLAAAEVSAEQGVNPLTGIGAAL